MAKNSIVHIFYIQNTSNRLTWFCQDITSWSPNTKKYNSTPWHCIEYDKNDSLVIIFILYDFIFQNFFTIKAIVIFLNLSELLTLELYLVFK